MPIFTSITGVEEFHTLLRHQNTNLLIVRFTASWCGPCKRIEPYVEAWTTTLPADVLFYELDVDAYPELYSFMKSKRRVNGIPALLCYSRGNHSYIPDEAILGADIPELQRFFEKCAVMHERNAAEKRSAT